MATRGTQILSPFVIDASVTMSWLFDDESDPGAIAVLASLDDGFGFVPRHWHLEVRNSLLIGERRGRITSKAIDDNLLFLNGLSLHTDTGANLDAALDLARSHGLSMYDAVYLELAVRSRIPLATLDRRLAQATSTEGVRTLP